MAWTHAPSPSGNARVLIVSQRDARVGLAQALQFEFEDEVRRLDAADLVSPVRSEFPSRISRRAGEVIEVVSPQLSEALAGGRPSVRGPYDLAVVVAGGLADLQFVWPLSWIFRSARATVCVIDELWREGLAARRGELRLLGRFDHVFAGTAGSVDAVSDLTGRPSSYLPPSVDALALCPFPDPAQRVIDVYSMGRRAPETHAALLEVTDRRRWFYLYDTISGGRAPDFRMHRRHLRDVLVRSRYFLAYPGKRDSQAETAGQEEIGYRYFEGAAAGAVLVGEAPRGPWFERLFDWEDAIVPLPYGCADPAAVAAALDLAPEREARIRAASVAGALRRHDHLHRWAEVLRRAGLPETPAMADRRRALETLACSLPPAPTGARAGAGTRSA